jgi:hypothetical protein
MTPRTSTSCKTSKVFPKSKGAVNKLAVMDIRGFGWTHVALTRAVVQSLAKLSTACSIGIANHLCATCIFLTLMILTTLEVASGSSEAGPCKSS